LDTVLYVLVRENNVDQALKVLKRRMQREGIFREMKQRKAYEKPSERKTREKAEAIRRSRKAARKQAIRDGLIAAPKPKPRFGAAGASGGPGGRRPFGAPGDRPAAPAADPVRT
jgi:small subunit ribosomal protein S21